MSNTLFPAPNELSPIFSLSVYTEVSILNLNKRLPLMDHSWTSSFCLGFTVCFGLVTGISNWNKKKQKTLGIYLFIYYSAIIAGLAACSRPPSPQQLFSAPPSGELLASSLQQVLHLQRDGRGGPGWTWPEHLWVLQASWPDAQNTSVESFDTGYRDI